MAAPAARALPLALGRLASACGRGVTGRPGCRAAPGAPAATRGFGRPPAPPRLVAHTSLSLPPWPEVVLPDQEEESRHHEEVVARVNELIAGGRYGRLFAVVHLAGHQWKVTAEDLILIANALDVACGDRLRLEKVLLVGADDFTLLGKPLLGKDLVRVEATVVEKTESWPKVNMKFRRRKNFQKKKIIVNPQTILRINSIELTPCLC